MSIGAHGRLRVARAALAEAGVDPDCARLNDEDVLCVPRSLDIDITWRMYTVTHLANGTHPCCRACFLAYRSTGEWEIVTTCDGLGPFALDCGRKAS